MIKILFEFIFVLISLVSPVWIAFGIYFLLSGKDVGAGIYGIILGSTVLYFSVRASRRQREKEMEEWRAARDGKRVRS